MTVLPAAWVVEPAGFAILFGILTVAAITDLRSRQVPNVLLGVGLLGHLTLAWLSGGNAIGQLSLGLLLALLIGLPTYLVGWFGGGDVKLLALVGAAVGPVQFLFTLPWILVAGGLVAILSERSKGVPYAVAILVGVLIERLWFIYMGGLNGHA